MANLPKRQLGPTGLQVTMLGYGAMELRGAPRAQPRSPRLYRPAGCRFRASGRLICFFPLAGAAGRDPRNRRSMRRGALKNGHADE
jgi:hypothetical protein